MPFLDVNGAQLFYETYGDEHRLRTPIVLIHGSTETGLSEWGDVAPLLARTYRVIVPDCRGHGRSTNPRRSYSFRAMAADTAALIGLLGTERAHVVGHSNGGNVALTVLLEHPNVVQTCVLEAANAYISPDLITREPTVFDPVRVERDDPSWRDRMVALHGSLHGADYWRELLKQTLEELLREPNYRPDDLARVQRPTLVIQGELDAVNAPAHHAQFIAQHLPEAEIWTPAGIGHTVHRETLTAWVEAVLGFLDRRGDEANNTIYRLKRNRFADGRENVFDVRAVRGQGVLRLEGRVLSEAEHGAVLVAFPAGNVDDRVQVLLGETTPWALVNTPVLDLRREPSRVSERLSQVLLGEAVRVLEDREDWRRVRMERDGYLGWVQSGGLFPVTPEEAGDRRRASARLVTGELAQAFEKPEALGEYAGKTPFGVALPLVEEVGDFAGLQLPDGRVWWVHASDLIPTDAQSGPHPEGLTTAVELMKRFLGVPYLWGGCTPFGFDCSGFTQAFLRLLGASLGRDADQQYLQGVPVVGGPRVGDLLFFGEVNGDGDGDGDGVLRRPNVTHVAISLGGDEIIHANGTDRCVALNSLNPTQPRYRAWLRDNLVGVRRYL